MQIIIFTIVFSITNFALPNLAKSRILKPHPYQEKGKFLTFVRLVDLFVHDKSFGSKRKFLSMHFLKITFISQTITI